MAYRLTRTTPRGDVRTGDITFKTVRDAISAAFYCLHDNGAATHAEANHFANKLYDAGLGTDVTHAPSGYVFRIDKA